MPNGELTDFAPGTTELPANPGLQDVFLAAASREQEAMTLFLVNGVMLQGSIAAFDQFSVLLERGRQVQLVYKHAISTLQPANPLKLGPEGGSEDGEDSPD
jgi:host factor-I protein